jgi:hypothetical protein
MKGAELESGRGAVEVECVESVMLSPPVRRGEENVQSTQWAEE